MKNSFCRKMKLLFIVTAFLYTSGVFCEEKYTSKFSNVNIEEILKSDRLLNAYFKCLSTDEGCTPDGEELRRILPEAIRNGCVKCTEEHKAGAKKITSFLIKHKPKLWEKLVAIYDPDNVYRVKYKDQLKAEGFDI